MGDSVLHSGFVTAENGESKTVRFLVLDMDTMGVSVRQDENTADAESQVLPLKGMERVDTSGSKLTLSFSMQSGDAQKVHVFHCKSEEDANDWAAALRKAKSELFGSEENRSRDSKRRSKRSSTAGLEKGVRHGSGRQEGQRGEQEPNPATSGTSSRKKSRVSLKSESGNGKGQAEGDIADLAYFEFVGGIVTDNNTLLWIAEKKPQKSPRMLGSNMLFMRLSMPFAGTDDIRKRTSSKPAERKSSQVQAERKNSKAERRSSKAEQRRASAVESKNETSDKPEKPVRRDSKEASGGANRKTKAQVAGEKLNLASVIEKNLHDKETGKHANKFQQEPKIILPAQGPPAKKKGFIARFFSKKSSSKSTGSVESPQPAQQQGAPEQGKSKEELKEKIARQARQAGGGTYNTGGGLVAIQKDIAEAPLAKKLNERKRDVEKKKAEEAQQAAVQAKSRPVEKAAPTKKTLQDFLHENEAAPNADPADAPTSPSKTGAANPNKLADFLSSSSS